MPDLADTPQGQREIGLAVGIRSGHGVHGGNGVRIVPQDLGGELVAADVIGLFAVVPHTVQTASRSSLLTRLMAPCSATRLYTARRWPSTACRPPGPGRRALLQRDHSG